jgi:hypothetical protein
MARLGYRAVSTDPTRASPKEFVLCVSLDEGSAAFGGYHKRLTGSAFEPGAGCSSDQEGTPARATQRRDPLATVRVEGQALEEH